MPDSSELPEKSPHNNTGSTPPDAESAPPDTGSTTLDESTISPEAGPPSPNTGVSSPLGHRLMFLLLTMLAFVLYAPTTLLPILRDYCNLLAEETHLTKTVASLERELEIQDQLTNAFKNDPLMNERLAVLDLHYHKPGEVVLPVLPVGYAKQPIDPPEEQHRAANSLHLPDHFPTWTLTVEHWANDQGLIKLFLDPTLRPIFLLMAAGLVIAAFVLFAPSSTTPNHLEAASSGQVRSKQQAVSL